MKDWMKDMFVRAVKTVIQTAIGMLGATTVLSEVDITTLIAASISAGLLSIIMSICTHFGIEVE